MPFLSMIFPVYDYIPLDSLRLFLFLLIPHCMAPPPSRFKLLPILVYVDTFRH